MFHPIIACAKRFSNELLRRHCDRLEREVSRLKRENGLALLCIADLRGELEETRKAHGDLMKENERLHSELGRSVPEQVRALEATRGGAYA